MLAQGRFLCWTCWGRVDDGGGRGGGGMEEVDVVGEL